MSITLFAGCSYTAGSGFLQSKEEPGLWVNLLHENNKLLKETKMLNVGINGRSNSGIFNDAVYNILHHDIKYAFVSWTSLIRYEMSIGLECYETRACMLPSSVHIDRNLNGVKYPASYLQNINDRLSDLAHPHYEIVNLISYVNSLILLCKLKDCQLFFINAVCDWDKDFFIRKHNSKPMEYTDYTKELISIDTRDDNEIDIIYNKMHNEYEKLGGIHPESWLNLNESLYSNKIDTNEDNIHPGLQSNYNYFKHLSLALESKIS